MMMLMNCFSCSSNEKVLARPDFVSLNSDAEKQENKGSLKVPFSLSLLSHIVPSRVQHHPASKRMYFTLTTTLFHGQNKKKINFWINKRKKITENHGETPTNSLMILFGIFSTFGTVLMLHYTFWDWKRKKSDVYEGKKETKSGKLRDTTACDNDHSVCSPRESCRLNLKRNI